MYINFMITYVLKYVHSFKYLICPDIYVCTLWLLYNAILLLALYNKNKILNNLKKCKKWQKVIICCPVSGQKYDGF